MQLVIVGCSLFALVLADINADLQIFKGKDAKNGSYPHQVGLFMERSGGMFMCSGSVISQTWIITAAHCVEDYPVGKITAFLGSVGLHQGTERKALKKIVHPQWNVKDPVAGNDIALLEIESISYSDTIKNISLPPLSESNLDYEGHIAVSSGWGLMNRTSIPDILQYTYLLVISNEACSKGFIFEIPIRKELICGADPDGSTGCMGDSGGPLVDVSSKTLIGITSFSPSGDCGTTHFGNAFTRVTSFRQWIHDNTGI